MLVSTTGSSSWSSCRSVMSCAMAAPRYLYLLVALNISVYPGDIQVVPRSHICHMRPVWSRCDPGGKSVRPRIPRRSHIDDSEVRADEGAHCSFVGSFVGEARSV